MVSVKSLQNAAQSFADRNQVNVGQPIDVLALASGLACPQSPPVSVSRLIAALEQDSFIFPVWNFGGGYFSGWTQLGLNADGTGSYKGHANDSGPVSYDYTVATVLLDVKDQAGNSLAFYHSGTVHGSLEIGSSNDDWQDDSLSCVVADNWDAVQTGRTWSHLLHTSIDPAGVAEVLLEAIVAAGLAVAGIVVFGSGGWTCQWFPGEGSLLRCEHA
jgi:hypothetical protein